MIDFLSLPVGPTPPEIVHAVIEVPLGGVNKYEYDKVLRSFRLDRTLHSPVHFPGDYGFIPSTLSTDGDPLDVLVLVDSPSFTGCLVEVKPVGVFTMLDSEVRDEKIIAVEKNNPRYVEIKEVSDLYPHVMREIEHFFSVYKSLENKATKSLGWQDSEHARKLIVESRDRFQNQTTAQPA